MIPAVLAGPIVGFAAYRLAANIEHDQVRAHLAIHAENAASALESEILADLEVLYSLKSHFETDAPVTDEKFARITQQFLVRHSCVQAFEWLPLVTREARPAHERERHDAGHPGYTITERSASGELVAAGERERYYPIAQLFPHSGNESALGFDVASDETRARAMARAAVSGQPILTDPIAPVQGTTSPPDFLGVIAVFDRESAADAAEKIEPKGFVLAVYRVETLLQQALGRRDADLSALQFELVDDDVNGEAQVMHSLPRKPEERFNGDGPVEQPISVGGQSWRLVANPSAEYLASLHTRQPMLLGVAAALGWELAVGLFFALGKRTRDRLKRRHSRRVTHILESLNDGVIVADRRGKVLFANQAAATVAGTLNPDIPPSSWSKEHGYFLPARNQLFPPEDLPLARAIRGETIDDVELEVRNRKVPNGMHVSVRGGPMLNGRGQVRGGVIVFRDITERKQADEHLRRLSNVVEQTADAVVITDREGTIEYVNPAFETATGYPAGEAIGETPRILKSGRQNREFYRELWGTITDGRTFRGLTVNRRKDGGLYHAEQTITPMTDDHGEITHFVSVFKDMTERRKIQEQEIELELASTVQQRLYPDTQPEIAGYDLAGAVFPAEATCGDYYDFVELPDGALAMVVADVSGHGLGPALVMAETRAYLRSLTKATSDLTAITDGLNGFLFEDLQENYFVTMLMARLEPSTGRLTYVSSAHPSGYVVGGSGEVVAELPSKCLPLGLFLEQWRCAIQETRIGEGEVAVLMTDGVLECEAPDGTEFGAERLLEVISAHREATAQEIVNQVYAAVQGFSRGAKQADDVTVIVCKRDSTQG